jgi:uncharacterized protein GlcG (DUF336 family)
VIDVAIKKAKTSALFEMETQTLDNYSKAGADAHGIELTNGHLVTFAGGIPLKGVDGQIIGSIGMSRGRWLKTTQLLKAVNQARSFPESGRRTSW